MTTPFNLYEFHRDATFPATITPTNMTWHDRPGAIHVPFVDFTNGWTRRTFTGSNGVDFEVEYRWLYGMEANTGSVYVIPVFTDHCPVVSNCDRGEMLLLGAAYTNANRYEVFDMNLAVLHGFQRDRVPVLGTGGNLTEAVDYAIRNTLRSMQVDTSVDLRGNTYGAVVYSERSLRAALPIEFTSNANGNIAHPAYFSDSILFIPAERQLIGHTLSMEYIAPTTGIWSGQPRTHLPTSITDLLDLPMVEATIDPPVGTVVGEESDEVARLRTRIGQQENIIRNLQSTIDTAKAVAWRYTRDNSGCSDGKRQFLTDLGLHDEDEIDEMFQQEYIVYVSVPVQSSASVAVTVRASSAEQAAEMVDEDVSSYIDTGDVLDSVELNRYNTEVDFNAAEVTDTDYA